ncbi:DNA repair exonuclease [Candidatus Synechococcus calcipolaris G9]|uniref:Nuclease SbcCD subunit D n=1 Tax=Candidatus Synechococcus calcipolaris G9 TaxID=1497997 RepID=A0ABT6F132_9SYNE|nr:DNA repair exonuclease [Candidatus Synechococcus calcipolaris]MDG2991571.1 DNA repair exonuclease [Candidatus Synechococcus calcipolaris G9]
MPRFLHVADIHLGFNKYANPKRTLDFFYAFEDALRRYALAPKVDFVVIAGDLFEERTIGPATLSHAELCLGMLHDAGIPVLAIEGNHDYQPYGSGSSWLRYLNSAELLYLLEPDENEDLLPWNPEANCGGYKDLDCGVRVIGSRWYGANAAKAVQSLAEKIEDLPAGPEYTVMLFHHGLEGQIARYRGALRYQELLPLQAAGVNYLALGHIHRYYGVEGWIFNPGSIEANSIAENQAQTPRGVLLVNLDQGAIATELKQDYYQRPIRRFRLEVHPHQTVNEIESGAIALMEQEKEQTKAAIVELQIEGQVGFDRHELAVRQLRECLEQVSEAFIFLLRYDVNSTLFETTATGEDGLPPRCQDIERTVFTDFLAGYARYRDQAVPLALGLMDIKERLIEQQSPEAIYGCVEHLLARDLAKNEIAIPTDETGQ